MDQSAPPSTPLNRLLTLLPRGLIRLYQALTIMVPHRCRFSPSCSHYFYDALTQRGLIRGARAGALRILKCHPWNPGGYDPVQN